MAGRSSHPIHLKRINVIIEPTDGEEGTYTVKTYTYVKRNSQRVPLVLRNDTSCEIILTKGMRNRLTITSKLRKASIERLGGESTEKRTRVRASNCPEKTLYSGNRKIGLTKPRAIREAF